MNASQIYILIALLGLLLIGIALVIIKKSKKKSKLTLLTSIAFVLIIGSFAFENRLIAYPILGVAVVLAVIDMIIKLKKK